MLHVLHVIWNLGGLWQKSLIVKSKARMFPIGTIKSDLLTSHHESTFILGKSVGGCSSLVEALTFTWGGYGVHLVIYILIFDDRNHLKISNIILFISFIFSLFWYFLSASLFLYMLSDEFHTHTVLNDSSTLVLGGW